MIRNRIIFLMLFVSISIDCLPQNNLPDTIQINKFTELGEKIYLQRPDSALYYWGEAKKLEEKIISNKDLSPQLAMLLRKKLAGTLNSLAYIFRNQGDIVKSLEYYMKALHLIEETNDKTGTAEIFNNIGVLYDYQNDTDNALEYYGKSLKILETTKDSIGMATLLNNIGFVYNLKNQKDKAIGFYNKSLAIRLKINDKKGIGESYNNIGAIYKDNGQYDKASEYLFKGLQFRVEAKNKRGIAHSYKNICDLYMRQNKFQPALEFALKSLDISQEMGYPELIMNAAEKLNKIYRTMGDYHKALDNYELFIQMRDSISNEKTRKEATKLKFKYEYEKKASADSVKVAEERKLFDAKMKQEETQRFALYIIIALTIVFAIFMYNRFRITKKQKQLIEIKEKETSVQKMIIETKHKEITASINYAKRIQHSLLPHEKYIEKTLERIRDKK